MSIARIALLSLALLVLTNCGQRICIMGVGDCSVDTKPSDNKTQESKKMLITAPSRDVKINERLELTISGCMDGTNGCPVTIVSGSGQLENGIGDKVIYVAPNQPGGATIKVVDRTRYHTDDDKDAYAYFSITILPE